MPHKGILQRFYATTLRTKLIVTFLLVVLIPIFFLAIVSERLISQKVFAEIEKATQQNLSAAWMQYYVRADQMKFGTLQIAEVIEGGILKNDKASLKDKMQLWESKRPYVNIWTIVDREGRVVARLNSDKSGDLFDLNGVVNKAISSGEVVISTEVMPRELLLKEGETLANEIEIPVIPNNHLGGYTPKYQLVTDAIVLIVVVPIMNDNKVIGASIAGNILNKDNFITAEMAREIPGSITTIAEDGVRIATTMPADNGEMAIGTTFPVEIVSAIKRGKNYTGEVTDLNKSYIAAVAPIKDYKGNAVGLLSVMVPKDKFIALHKHNRFSIAAMAGLGILLATSTAIFVTSKLTKPLIMLVQKSKDVASGNMDVIIPVDAPKNSEDEISILIRSFNQMVEEIKDRNSEREVYLIELEKKTTALAETNEKLQESNQELEVALEEAQSQQEELQSANEELTILNEELEKKTDELFDANTQITKEETELKKMRDQLRLIFNGIKDYIFLLDPSCTILGVNRPFLDAYGLQEKDVIGRTCYDLVYGLNKFAPECDISNGSDITMPHRYIATSKDNRILERHVFPVCDSNGKLVNKVEYIRDITVETTLREQLLQAEKLSSIGEMLSGIAHELNNPLTGVIGYCELLHETTKDKELKEQLGRINDSALRCKKIVENMLSFSRQHKIEKQYSDINSIIKQTVELKSYQLKVDNIEVIMTLDENIPNIMVDPYMMQQVFLNIINNAHIAMMDKGEPGTLSIKSEYKKGVLKLSFTDTGTGISDTNLKKIFDPFFTTRDIGKGTGLGLSVSYGIIKEHKGVIYATGKPGEGATFFIELPVLHQEKVIAEGKGEAMLSENSEMVSKKKILVIDDEPTLLELFKTIIGEMGHEVDTYSDARLAIENISNKEYDLILSDMRMPGMGGKEFYNMISDLRPELKKNIVFTTGDAINPDTQNFLKNSGSKYIEKPFTPADLRKLISDHFKT